MRFRDVLKGRERGSRPARRGDPNMSKIEEGEASNRRGRGLGGGAPHQPGAHRDDVPRPHRPAPSDLELFGSTTELRGRSVACRPTKANASSGGSSLPRPWPRSTRACGSERTGFHHRIRAAAARFTLRPA